MKTWTLRFGVAALTCAAIALVFVAASAIHTAGVMTRSDTVACHLDYLAMMIERYRHDHGRYPSSFEELLAGSGEAFKDWLHRHRVFGDDFHDVFEYHILTNGFQIIVTAPPSLLGRYQTVERRWRAGEGNPTH
jgi:hypothetical protein